MRRISSLLVLVAAIVAAGCSGSTKKDAEEPDTKWDMDSEDGGSTTKSDKPDPEPARPGDDDDDDPPEPKPKRLTQDDDYEINHRDCDALAEAYGRAWKRDEMEKLNKSKLSKEKFEKASADLDTNADGMKDNWRDECYNTVGTAYLRSRLKCAMKSKSLKRFNDCMDGLADQ